MKTKPWWCCTPQASTTFWWRSKVREVLASKVAVPAANALCSCWQQDLPAAVGRRNLLDAVLECAAGVWGAGTGQNRQQACSPSMSGCVRRPRLYVLTSQVPSALVESLPLSCSGSAAR